MRNFLPYLRLANANTRRRGERIKALEHAIAQASYALDPNQGEKADPSRAYQWLRTTYRKDHPNYVDPASLA